MQFKLFFSTFAHVIEINSDKVKNIYYLLLTTMVLCVACQFKLNPDEGTGRPLIEVARYDRLEYRYLTTGDFSALQEMNTEYPVETRMLIEDVLQIGEATDPEINNKFLKFYQDTTLQMVIADTETRYAQMDDLNRGFNMAFTKLVKWLPDMPLPTVYAQISALDQSIVVGNQSIGISLDKYLGEDYPLYQKYYSPQQRQQMRRENILPDALSFYIISQYPLNNFETRPQEERDIHMAKIQWIVNQALSRHVFHSRYVTAVENYMHHNRNVSYEQLLRMTDFTKFKSLS